MFKFTNKYNQKGITLIALIVTIIVMMILARSILKRYSRKQWNTNKSKRSEF